MSIPHTISFYPKLSPQKKSDTKLTNLKLHHSDRI